MIIPTVDTGLEALLRKGLPLPETVGDISFESPSGTWSAQLSRITVNLFLFGVGRSAAAAAAVRRPHGERPTGSAATRSRCWNCTTWSRPGPAWCGTSISCSAMRWPA